MLMETKEDIYLDTKRGHPSKSAWNYFKIWPSVHRTYNTNSHVCF